MNQYNILIFERIAKLFSNKIIESANAYLFHYL